MIASEKYSIEYRIKLCPVSTNKTKICGASKKKTDLQLKL